MGSRPATAPADYTRKNLVGSSSSSSSSSNVSHKAQVSALAWSATGKKLASGSHDGVVKVWSVTPDTVQSAKSDKAEYEWNHGKQEVVSYLVFNPRRDDQLLVVGGHVSRVYQLGNKGSTSLLCEVDIPDAISATWDTHDNILVAQLHNKLTHIDLRKGADKKRETRRLLLRANGDEVTDVAFIDRGRRVLVATQHGVEVRSWPGFELLTVLDGHVKHGGRDGGVTAIAVTREEDVKPLKPFTRLLATGGNDTLICIWDLQQGVPSTIIYRPDEAVRALSFSADQSLLAYCQEDVPGQKCNVEVMDVKTGAHVTTIDLQRGTEVLAFNPRYNKLLALAEPCVISTGGGYRDSKTKDTPACLVSLVLMK